MSDFVPSVYQQAFFDWIKKGKGDAVLQAVAGSGKTTTTVEALALIPVKKRALFLAFNKSIAEELQSRAPRHVEVRTLNSLGHRAWGQAIGKLTLDKDKTRGIVDELFMHQKVVKYGAAVRRLVGIAKSQGFVPVEELKSQALVEDTEKNWLDLIEYFDIEPCANAVESDLNVLVHMSREVLKESIAMKTVIDFDDQLYMPVIHGTALVQYDWVFIDEAQDLSPIQWNLVEMARSKTRKGRVVAVGDSRQAIYGWRGADSSSMANFKLRNNATELPLSICYRCPKSHVALAQQIVPQILAAETAEDGIVGNTGYNWVPGMFTRDDLIICRNNAPLVKLAYKLLAAKVAVKITGRDLGVGLISLIKKLKATSTLDLITKLNDWRVKETKKLRARNPEATTEKIDDKVDTIMVFIDMVQDATPDSICLEIQRLYTDDRNSDVLTLSTVHRAKGSEADRVFVLNRDLMPSAWAFKPWQAEQEQNLIYVALTRSKFLLDFIDIEMKKKKNRDVEYIDPINEVQVDQLPYLRLVQDTYNKF